jgi:hypothetical protein
MDIEDAVVKEISIDGEKAFLSIKETIKILIWHDNEIAYEYLQYWKKRDKTKRC